MKKVYDDTAGAAHPTYTGCIASFGDLEVCPVEELEKIIKSAQCKSRELDPVPASGMFGYTAFVHAYAYHVQFFSHFGCTTRISEEGYRHTKVEKSRYGRE